MIQNIIFDFGNVLFDLDLAAFEREMKNLWGENFSIAKEKLLRERVFELYETGGLSTSEFVEKLSRASEIPLRPEQIIAAWNAIFIGMPQHRFELLLRLRQRYKVFLLSNINDLHERWIADYMLREHGLPDYESLHFDGVYFSHLIRLRKPMPEVFEYVLADAEMLAAQTVFFDDLPENVEAARRVGIQGVWHEPGTEIGERLVEMQLLPPLTSAPIL
ncbi:MAG: HAD family hydrolase [Saprospiraceae bacterium]